MHLCLGLQLNSVDKYVSFYAIKIRFFFITLVFYYGLKSGMDGDAFKNYFIVQNCFSYTRIFDFLYEVEHCPFKVYKELCWNFNGNVLNT